MDPGSLAAGLELGPRGRRRAQLRRQRRDRLRRSRRRLVAAMGALVVVGVVLVAVGWTKVRDSTPGQYIDPSLSPDEPGYAAMVEPTPTMLVLQQGPDGELAGVALLGLRSGDQGGSVIVMPTGVRPDPDTEAGTDGDVGTGDADEDAGSADEDADADGDAENTDTVGDAEDAEDTEGQAATLAALYEEGGAEAVVTQVETLLNIAVHESVELDDEGWASLVEPVNPVSLRLEDAVALWPAGRLDLTADQVGEFLAAHNPDESELGRVGRQQLFWREWLPRMELAGADSVPGEASVGMGRFVRGLISGDVTVSELPVEVVDDVFEEQFVPSPVMMEALVAQEIPFPQEPTPGSRIRVRVLNGTNQRDLTVRAAAPLVEAGAEIAVTGNAASFEEPRTRLVYATQVQQESAEALRDALGIGVVEAETSDEGIPLDIPEGDRIDVTVILGADAPEAIGRLENPD